MIAAGGGHCRSELTHPISAMLLLGHSVAWLIPIGLFDCQSQPKHFYRLQCPPKNYIKCFVLCNAYTK